MTEVEKKHAISVPETAKRFLFAGNATFTIVSKKTEERFTFRIRASEKPRLFFVDQMVGPSNESDFRFIGTSNAEGSFYVWKKLKEQDTPAIKALRWFLPLVGAGHLPSTVELWHEGRCGRCGRRLTVPSSIETGLGPECAGKS